MLTNSPQKCDHLKQEHTHTLRLSHNRFLETKDRKIIYGFYTHNVKLTLLILSTFYKNIFSKINIYTLFFLCLQDPVYYRHQRQENISTHTNTLIVNHTAEWPHQQLNITEPVPYPLWKHVSQHWLWLKPFFPRLCVIQLVPEFILQSSNLVYLTCLAKKMSAIPFLMQVIGICFCRVLLEALPQEETPFSSSFI